MTFLEYDIGNNDITFIGFRICQFNMINLIQKMTIRLEKGFSLKKKKKQWHNTLYCSNHSSVREGSLMLENPRGWFMLGSLYIECNWACLPTGFMSCSPYIPSRTTFVNCVMTDSLVLPGVHPMPLSALVLYISNLSGSRSLWDWGRSQHSELMTGKSFWHFHQVSLNASY